MEKGRLFMKVEQTVADHLVEKLKDQGVDTVFGIISIHMIGIYDAIQRDGNIRLIVPRHEQGVLHMADGYARATGRIGVALTSTGPGAANAMGAMFEAYTAHSRVLQITSQIPSPYLDLRRGEIHEAKAQEQMLEAVSDCVIMPRTIDEVHNDIEKVFEFLDKPGGGPAVLTLPVDLQTLPLPSASITTSAPDKCIYTATENDYDRAASIMAAAENPVVLLGSGIVAAACNDTIRSQLIDLVEKLDAAVLVAWEARGVIPEDHPQVMVWTMQIGATMHLKSAESFLQHCDAALVIGSRIPGILTDQWQIPLPKNLIRVDIDSDKLNLNYPAAVGIHDTAENSIPELLNRLDSVTRTENSAAQKIATSIQKLKDNSDHPHYQRLAHIIREALPRDGIIVADSTQTTYFGFLQTVPFYEPRTFQNMTGGAIGPSLPMAMGAAVGMPRRKIIQVAGDGGYLFNLGELAALGEYQLGVVSIVMNDGGYGILRGYQAIAYEGRHVGVDLKTPDYVAIAEACNVPGERVDSYEHFAEVLKHALTQNSPFLIEVNVAELLK